ncbi:MAG: extracellular solute-binding protein [Firmicutes bacterium]|nr:extracellular solute-binding protein [Bacillota bacterium]
MRSTRRLVCLACGVLLVLLGTLQPGPALAEERPITITWWINPWRIAPPDLQPDQAPTAEDFPRWISQEFMKRHPNVTVRYEVLTNQGFDQKVAAAILAGNPPDVLRPINFRQEWVRQGLLEPIAPYLTPFDWEDFYDYALDEGKVGDHYYLFPWNNSNNGMGSTLLLNPRMFAQRGVALPPLPDRAWTMDEFMEAARKLSYDTNGDGVNDYYALAMSARMDLMNNLAWFHIFGARYVDEQQRRFVLNSPEGVRALTWMVDAIHKERIAPPGAEGMGIYDVINLFHQQRIAIGYGGPYEIGRIDRYLKEGRIQEKFPAHVAQFPHFPEIGPVAYHTSGGFVVFKQADPYKREMVMEFVRFLTSPENMKLLRSLLYVTARKSVNEGLYEGYEFEDEIAVYLRAIEHGIPYFGSAELDTTPADNHFIAMLEAAFSRNRTPQQALDEFVAQANRLVFRGR